MAAETSRRDEIVAETGLVIGASSTHSIEDVLALARGALRVRKSVPRLTQDRRQDRDIERVLAMLREDALPLGPV